MRHVAAILSLDDRKHDGTARERRRGAVITQAGDRAELGRHRDSDEVDLENAAEALARAGMAGWLAVTEGVYYSDRALDVLMVHPLHGAGDWDAALAAFHEKRQAKLAKLA